jgi:hypothetical protein
LNLNFWRIEMFSGISQHSSYSWGVSQTGTFVLSKPAGLDAGHGLHPALDVGQSDGENPRCGNEPTHLPKLPPSGGGDPPQCGNGPHWPPVPHGIIAVLIGL